MNASNRTSRVVRWSTAVCIAALMCTTAQGGERTKDGRLNRAASGRLSVIAGVGQPVNVTLVAKSIFVGGGDEIAVPPVSDATSFGVGTVFYLEAWAQRNDPGGLSAVSLDISFDPTQVMATGSNAFPFSGGIFHGSVFSGIPNGVVDNVIGKVDDLGGLYGPVLGCVADPTGVGPVNWSRVAVVEMVALVATSPTILPSGTGNPIFGTAGCGTPDIPQTNITYTGINEPSVDLVLNVAPGSTAVQQGDTVTVTLDANNITAAINGVQALFNYDPALLSLTGIATRDLGFVLPAIGWFEVDATDFGGDVSYAASIFGASTAVDGIVATLTFTAIGVGTTNLSFLPDNPPSFPLLTTKATNAATGQPITPVPIDSALITIAACNDGLTCTADSFDGANCVFTINLGTCLIGGTCFNAGDVNPANGCEECNPALIDTDWSPRPNTTPCDDTLFCTTGEVCTAGACGGGLPTDCSASADQCNNGVCDETANACVAQPVADLTPCNDTLFCTTGEVCTTGVCGGGAPTDCSDVNVCTVDTCDETAGMCVNTDITQIDVTLQVEALGNAVMRPVTFELSDCFGGLDIRVEPVMFDALGNGSITLPLTGNQATSILATEAHTLTRGLPLAFAGACQTTVDFVVGTRLLAGDFSNAFVPQDNLVDISDFAILAINWNQTIDPNAGFGADATGNGFQDLADFTAIAVNFGIGGDGAPVCVASLSPSEPNAELGNRTIVRTSLSAREFPQGEYADMDGDGVIDARDVQLFVDLNAIPMTPQVRGFLDRLQRAGTPSRDGVSTPSGLEVNP